MLSKMVTDNLVHLYRGQYELETKQIKKVTEYQKKHSKKNDSSEAFPPLTKVKHQLKKDDTEDEAEETKDVTKKTRKKNEITIYTHKSGNILRQYIKVTEGTSKKHAKCEYQLKRM